MSDFIFVSTLTIYPYNFRLSRNTYSLAFLRILYPYRVRTPACLVRSIRLMYAGIHLRLSFLSAPINYDDVCAQRLLLGKICSPIPSDVPARDGWI